MARRERVEATADAVEQTEQETTLDACLDDATERPRRAKKETKKVRVTLSLSEDVARRLRNAANYEGMTSCEVVEMLIDAPLRPYVVSLRGKRIVRQPGEAA